MSKGGLDGWPIIEDMLKREGIARQHLNSYNEFIERGLQSIIDEVGDIEIESALGSYRIRLGRIEIGRPKVVEQDGSETHLYPMEARLRNLTYAAPLYLEMMMIDPQNVNLPYHPQRVFVGNLPVMVKSKICALHGLTEEELIDIGEDPKDPGGYFIINGSER